jgi:hypothetical protein
LAQAEQGAANFAPEPAACPNFHLGQHRGSFWSFDLAQRAREYNIVCARPQRRQFSDSVGRGGTGVEAEFAQLRN